MFLWDGHGIPAWVSNLTTHVHLAWDASPDPSVVGYRVYWGPASGFYTNSAAVGNTTNCTITNLSHATYYFNATAYNSTGQESVFSGEISATVPYNPPFTNYVLLDWVRHVGTNRVLASRLVLTNPPGDMALFEAKVTQTNDQVRVLRVGRVISISNTNQ